MAGAAVPRVYGAGWEKAFMLPLTMFGRSKFVNSGSVLFARMSSGKPKSVS